MDFRNDIDFFKLLTGSYARLLGEPLVPPLERTEDAMHWLYDEAPYGLLAHNTAEDPVFVYGNRRAQSLFGYGWDELTALPSRLSAEAPERHERQAFLDQVTRHGFVTGYRGVRISKHGRRFWIERATVWQLIDEHGVLHGQAAMIPQTADLPDQPR
ncbi:MEKHLA domain-containing protein [Trinickia terrae]|uniref:MEKHLA domain-containing protein n=1 Tax=Trinickia terrae TaxID=2571161 RepID=A0A4U1HMP3_9BURK|nr:MEKHLA domain-containing protein [Trinickia terrae]TKC81423.1 MEKHLA domain-containing protein [Trinickia terrae]